MNPETKRYSGTAYDGTTNDNSKDVYKVLIGALAGAAAGSLIAGLFTQKGIETRKKLGDSSRNLANNLKDKVSNIKEGIADKYEATKAGAANLIEKGKQKVGMSPTQNAYKGTAEADAKGSGSKVLLGVLAVSVAGTLIWGFATEKGKETRKRIGKGSKNIAGNLKEKFSDIADGVADTYEAAKEGAVDLLEKGKQNADMSSPYAYRDSTGADRWEG